jgi:DNA-binding transcriptional regulator YiaG
MGRCVSTDAMSYFASIQNIYFSTRPKINMDDKVRKGRQARGAAHALATEKNRTRGENSPNAKLTFQQVQEIRASAMTQRKLAEIYGVARSTISRIKRRERWR